MTCPRSNSKGRQAGTATVFLSSLDMASKARSEAPDMLSLTSDALYLQGLGAATTVLRCGPHTGCSALLMDDGSPAG